MEVAERQISTPIQRLPTRFNGAATWKSRKAAVIVCCAPYFVASMGPRLGSRGKIAMPVGFSSTGYASMGPRLGSRGKRANWPSPTVSLVVLQWGRDLEVAERVAFWFVDLVLSGFNGAATWKSRKVARARNRRSNQGCFNGAATWKSRKANKTNLLGNAPPSFNGAATWKSRKELYNSIRKMRPRLLQWGRDLEVAESPS